MAVIRSRPSGYREVMRANMQVLTSEEIGLVFGGNGGKDAPEKKPPESSPKEPGKPKEKERFDLTKCISEYSSLPGVSENSAMINCTTIYIYNRLMSYY